VLDISKETEEENLWAYGKRLRFMRQAIGAAFPERDPGSIRVLDVGCGNGSQLALPLAGGHGFQITGIDLDRRSIEHAILMAGERAHVNFRCGRIEDLSDEQPFDVVILSEVLEHLEQPAELLAASIRLMDASGIVIVTVPNGYGEFELDSWVFRKLRLQRVVDALAGEQRAVLGATDNHESGHVQFFTRRRLRRLFDGCGLVSISEGAGSLLSGPMVGHLLGRSDRLIQWNARVTNYLPSAMASSWYFVLRQPKQERRPAGQ
jgi:SAM-dependent methyltransferase